MMKNIKYCLKNFWGLISANVGTSIELKKISKQVAA